MKLSLYPVSLILLFASGALEAQAPEDAYEYDNYLYRRQDRFHEDLGLGTLGFLPNVTDRSLVRFGEKVFALPKTGFYEFPAEPGNHCFFVSSYAPSHVGQESYVGVLILQVLGSLSEPDPQVTVYRRGLWHRPGDSEYSAANGRPLGLRLSPLEFFAAHDTARSAMVLDAILGRPWHGWYGSHSRPSFRDRTSWVPSEQDLRRLESWFPALRRDWVNARLEAQLLHFRVSSEPKSDEGLSFCLKGADLTGVYLRIFSPDYPAFGRRYFLSFEK